MPLRTRHKTLVPLKANRAIKPQKLTVPMIGQDQTNWCWAACLQMVLAYTKQHHKQCDFASFALNCFCCQIPVPYYCNSPLNAADISKLFTQYRINSAYTEGFVTFATLSAEIESRRPVEAGILWNDQTGHVVLVVGTAIISGKQVVYINDPAWGCSSGGYTFSTLLSGFACGRWSASWTSLQTI